ncbi:MAG TPA: hypothetical protein VK421_03710 [Pyrinomonadaceae bacterium]|nr:hypothetical protein [Pyrinomonadaceae bacterium]
MSRPTSSRDRFEDYVPVAERLERFYERYPEGRITTAIVQHDLETGFVLMRAEVYRTPDDAQPAATGHAFEVRGESYVNKTSYIENAETSSVGRALAMLGFEVKRGIASREELQKTARMQPAGAAAPPAERAAKGQPPAPPAPAAADESAALDRDILEAAGSLGYDAAKVRKWVNQKFKVSDGLDTLTPELKREVLKIFRERAATA